MCAAYNTTAPHTPHKLLTYYSWPYAVNRTEIDRRAYIDECARKGASNIKREEKWGKVAAEKENASSAINFM